MKKKSPTKKSRKVQEPSLSRETQNVPDKTKSMSEKNDSLIQGDLEILIDFQHDDLIHSFSCHLNKKLNYECSRFYRTVTKYAQEAIKQRQANDQTEPEKLSGFLQIQCHIEVQKDDFLTELCYELCHSIAQYIKMIAPKKTVSSTLSLPDDSTCTLYYLTTLNELRQTIVPTPFHIEKSDFLPAKQKSEQNDLSQQSEIITADSIEFELTKIQKPVVKKLHKWLSGFEGTTIPVEDSGQIISEIKWIVARAGHCLIYEEKSVALYPSATVRAKNASINVSTLGKKQQEILYSKTIFPALSTQPIR